MAMSEAIEEYEKENYLLEEEQEVKERIEQKPLTKLDQLKKKYMDAILLKIDNEKLKEEVEYNIRIAKDEKGLEYIRRDVENILGIKLKLQKRIVVKKIESPYIDLDYVSEHLPYFDDLRKLLGLYGKHYRPLMKARWYQLLGGVLQQKIRFGQKYTDTRVNCIYPLPTESGKNDFIYLLKDIIPKVRKGNEKFRIEEPTSMHPEQLIGKVIEREIPNPRYVNGEVTKPKKIKTKIENRGYFDNDFLEFDEANALIYSNEEQIRQAREHISKATNTIGANEVVKKLVDDLPDERVSYYPNCTISLYLQPKKIHEDLVKQGFIRRFLIPVGRIEPFLNEAREEDFKRKSEVLNFSRESLIEKGAEYLSSIYSSCKGKEFIFSEGSKELLLEYLQYLLIQGKVHSQKISNMIKIFNWTIFDYFIRFSCIIAGSYRTNIVTKEHIQLAFMDLTELLQAHFDFIDQRIEGNLDYGVGWKGAEYKDRICLEHLYNEDCLSLEKSTISIAEFKEYIEEIYKVRKDQAQKIWQKYKENDWVEGKQIGQYDSRVWLKFDPQIDNIISQGHKGSKGYNLYKSVISNKNTIISTLRSLSPLSPSKEETV